MKRVLSLFILVVLFTAPQAAVAQSTVCQCQVVVVGEQSPPPAGTSQACPVMTLTINATGGNGSAYTLDASTVTPGAPPASVTGNPPTCVPPATAVGNSQITIPADQCNTNFTGSVDVGINVNQSTQIFTGTVTNCQARILSGEQDFDIVLTNPLATDNPMELIATGIRAGLGVIGSLTLVAFIAGGVMWVTSAGNADRVKQGLNTMLYAAIGVAVIFTAYAVLQFVLGSVGAG